MSDNEDNVIDVEAVEIPDGGDNLPAVIPKPKTHDRDTHGSAEPMPESAESPSLRRDWSTYSRPERRCTANSSRTGEQCKNVAIKGHNVCRYHGGAAKQVKRAAQIRLDNASELMAKQLLGIALSADSEAVKLAAVKDALDRTIGKASTTVEIGPTKPYEDVMGDVFQGISPMTRAESRRARGLPRKKAPSRPLICSKTIAAVSDTSRRRAAVLASNAHTPLPPRLPRTLRLSIRHDSQDRESSTASASLSLSIT